MDDFVNRVSSSTEESEIDEGEIGGNVDIGKAIIGGVLIGLGAFVAVAGVVIVVVTVPAATAEVAIIPPVGFAHVALGAVIGGFTIMAGVGIMAVGGYAIYTSGVIPGTSPQSPQYNR